MTAPSANGRVSPGIIVLVIVFAALGIAGWSAVQLRQAKRIPENHDITAETFGTGIAIGMRLEEAQAAQPKSKVPIQFATAEELANHDFYHEHDQYTDLVAVIHGNDGVHPEDTVHALQAYMALPDKSKLTLGSKQAWKLKPDDVKAMFGPPYNTSAVQDGRTHLTYYFADPANNGMAYKLTTSHEYDGHMFSKSLEHVIAPQ